MERSTNQHQLHQLITYRDFTHLERRQTMQRILLPIVCVGLSLFLVACSSTGVLPVGENSYMLSKQTATGYQTAVKIRSEVMQEASAYCSKSNKHFVIQDMQSRDGVPGRSYATVSLTFGCYDKSDPIYRASQPKRGADHVKEIRLYQDVKVEKTEKGATDRSKDEPTGQKDVYTELIKLDDLRKKGILSDAEFEAQKKKLLSEN